MHQKKTSKHCKQPVFTYEKFNFGSITTLTTLGQQVMLRSPFPFLWYFSEWGA